MLPNARRGNLRNVPTPLLRGTRSIRAGIPRRRSWQGRTDRNQAQPE